MHCRGLTASLFSLAVLAAFVPGSALLSRAQQSSAAAGAVTVADYQRAEKFLAYNTRPLVFHEVRAMWLSGDRFWYRDTGPDGTQFVMYDAAHGTRQPAFDHAKIAAALSTAGGKTYDAGHLPFMGFEFSPDEKAISFPLHGQTWKCDLQAYSCAAEAKRNETEAKPAPGVKSPDGKSEAFIRDWNLWVRDVASGKETQLTTDGVKDFGYATDNAGWTTATAPSCSGRPIPRRSPPTSRTSAASAKCIWSNTKVGHPKLEAWKYPLPGDDVVTTIQRVIIDVDGPRSFACRCRRTSTARPCATTSAAAAATGPTWSGVPTRRTWRSSPLRAITSTRHLRVADAATGAVRDVLEETVDPVSSPARAGSTGITCRHRTKSSGFPSASNWGHLYLYDLATGKLKNQITTGDWNVTQVLQVDEKNRVIYFLGDGREKGEIPTSAISTAWVSTARI